jgi:predicted enzyme related to lactoylglutathione lyase
MPEMTSYDHGVPSWVDIGTSDPQASLAFYSELFGWEGQDQGEEAGHYTIASKGGKQVAAISPSQDPGPPRWTTYINVNDIDAAASKAQGAGGTVIVSPMDVMTAGRMAIFADTTGAVIAAWQPGTMHGADVVNEAGAFIWSELSTSDLAKSKAFYTAVFDWGWGGVDEYAEGHPTCPPRCPTPGWCTSARRMWTQPSRRRPSSEPVSSSSHAIFPGRDDSLCSPTLRVRPSGSSRRSKAPVPARGLEGPREGGRVRSSSRPVWHTGCHG